MYSTMTYSSPCVCAFDISEHERHSNMLRHIRAQLPTDAKILAYASARIYYLPLYRSDIEIPAISRWKYTQRRGMLIFGKDLITLHPDRRPKRSQLDPLTGLATARANEDGAGDGSRVSGKETYWFRLVDEVTGNGMPIWEYTIPPPIDDCDGDYSLQQNVQSGSSYFDYTVNMPFFHELPHTPGKPHNGRLGFRFDEDQEAKIFYREVMKHIGGSSDSPLSPNTTSSSSSSTDEETTSPQHDGVHSRDERRGARQRVIDGLPTRRRWPDRPDAGGST